MPDFRVEGSLWEQLPYVINQPGNFVLMPLKRRVMGGNQRPGFLPIFRRQISQPPLRHRMAARVGLYDFRCDKSAPRLGIGLVPRPTKPLLELNIAMFFEAVGFDLIRASGDPQMW